MTTYREACDGSAAVSLDDALFAVADDDSNVLRIYRRGQAKPVWSNNLDKFLRAPKNKKGEFKEADLEGAARIGDRIYWIGSHGRDGEGDAEPGRARFFATRVVIQQNEARLEEIGSGAYQSLREDLFASTQLADLNLTLSYVPEKEKKGPNPESDNGFNIEALAATADGRLLIGFRNPRPKGQAILIPLTNPADVVEKGAKPVFGKSVLLELGGRGIRSIDRVGERYVIVAGSHGPADKSTIMPPFALFTWSGAETDTRPGMAESVAWPEKFAPEALIAHQGGSMVTLLSDDGDINNCKKAKPEQKAFRALTLPAPK